MDESVKIYFEILDYISKNYPETETDRWYCIHEDHYFNVVMYDKWCEKCWFDYLLCQYDLPEKIYDLIILYNKIK